MIASAVAPVHPMNGVDAQLLFDELRHVGHGQLGVGVAPTGAAANLVPERAADGISVMSIGDQDRTRTDGVADRLDPRRVDDAFDGVHHAVLVGAVPDRFAGFGQQVGQPGRQ